MSPINKHRSFGPNRRRAGFRENLWGQAVAFLFAVVFWGLFLDIFFDNFVYYRDSWLFWLLGGAVLVGFALYLASVVSRRGLSFFYHPHFVISLLFFLTVSVALGTLILQNLPREQYGHYYGFWHSVILFLQWDDLFHSYWFGSLLLLLGGSLLLYALSLPKKKKNLPLLLLHLAPVLVIVGGLFSHFGGKQGRMNLHIGEKSRYMDVYDRSFESSEPHSLPFAVKLEDFAITKYPRNWFLVWYHRGKKDYRLYDIPKIRSVTRDNYRVEVERFFPAYRLLYKPKETQKAGKTYPCLKVAWPNTGFAEWLFVGSSHYYTTIPAQERRVFAFASQDAFEKNWGKALHLAYFKNKAFVLKPRQKVALASGYAAKLVQFLPDYSYDIQNRRPYSKSSAPNNPAARIALYRQGQKLSEEWYQAQKGMGSGELTYRYLQAVPLLKRNYVYIHKKRRLYSLDSSGKLTPLATLRQKGGLGSGDETAKLPRIAKTRSACAMTHKVKKIPQQKGEAAYVRLKAYKQNGQKLGEAELFYQVEKNRVALDDDNMLMLYPTRQEPKNYYSTISLWRNGKQIAKEKIYVNEPLRFGGYWLYQSSYEENDPSYSGLLVVRDPGLGPVYAGLGLLVLATLMQFVRRQRRRHALK